MKLFYSIKDLDENQSDISSIIRLFTDYFNEFEYRNCKSGYRFLLSGINVYSKYNASIFDIINEKCKENDYLKKLFINKYSNVYGISPITSGKSEFEYVVLSKDLVNDLKILGFENLTIKRTDKHIQVVEMIVDAQGASISLLSKRKVDILQFLLKECYYHYKHEPNRLCEFGFEGNDFDNVIKLAVLLFGAQKRGLSEMKLLSFVKNDTCTKSESSVIVDEEKNIKLRKDVLKRGCYKYICWMLNEKRNDDEIAVKFLSYFEYMDFECVDKLFGLMKEIKRETLANFLSQKYFVSVESKLSQFMMNDSEYIHDFFEKTNQVLSSMENGKEFVQKIFTRFNTEKREYFTNDIMKRMRRRLKLNENSGKYYPQISLKNSKIINYLLASKEYIQVVENHLGEMYDEIGGVERWDKYFESKFLTSGNKESHAKNFSPTISNFVIIYLFQSALCDEIRVMIKRKERNKREKGEIKKIKPFFTNKLIDPCILIDAGHGYTRWSTLYYYAAYKGDEEVVKLLGEQVDNDIIKYTPSERRTHLKGEYKCTESPLVAAMRHGHWSVVKYISLVLFLFFVLCCLIQSS